MLKFKDNATYNKDYNTIILALAKIIDKGALERFFRIEGKMSDNVAALSIDSRKLRIQSATFNIWRAYDTEQVI